MPDLDQRHNSVLHGLPAAALLAALSVVSLSLIHEAVPALLRPMFGSIPLTVQSPVALRISLVASVAAGILLQDRIQHTRTLCFGLGASLAAAIVIVRQVAKHASSAGALGGSLWALVALTLLPTAYAALLFTRCAETFTNRTTTAVHPPWHRLALRTGLTLIFVTIVDKMQPFLAGWSTSFQPTDGVTKAIALLSFVLLVLGNIDYRGQAHADKVMNFWIVVHATLLALALQSVFRNVKYPIVSAKGGLRILNSTQSITGRVVVAENVGDGYRFLRCDHSLLGGRWVKENERGVTLYGDSIFSAFVLQEAGRLAWRDKEVEDEVLVAEIIGLGVSITADAMIRHGYRVRVIELDPAVYHAARTHFNLAAPDEIILTDALKVVTDRANRLNKKKRRNSIDRLSDLVIHDCFTGGSVPAELFTVEFWNDLALSMKPDGILVVNFAGILRSEASQAVFRTLWYSFPQCRAFQDKYGHKDKETGEELANMVIICSRAFSPLLAFRPSEAMDYLKSPLRLHVLGSFLQHEMLPDHFIAGFKFEQDVAEYGEGKIDPHVLRRGDGMGSLDKWQLGSALATWDAMRQIMPVDAWMTY